VLILNYEEGLQEEEKHKSKKPIMVMMWWNGGEEGDGYCVSLFWKLIILLESLCENKPASVKQREARLNNNFP
jgi:hypothetical protein